MILVWTIARAMLLPLHRFDFASQHFGLGGTTFYSPV